jgi:antitoxin component of MazEF toxin-antitoxin module
MRIPIIDIGNSKGIRIPQAVLKQVMFAEEVEMEVREGGITLKRAVDPGFVPFFEAVSRLDDRSIQKVLQKITGADLIAALVGAEEAVKNAVYRNLSARVHAYLKPTVDRLEKGDARDLIIEMSRSVVCEAMMEMMRE